MRRIKQTYQNRNSKNSHHHLWIIQMQLHRFNSLLLMSLVIIAIFGSASSYISCLFLSKDLLLLAETINYQIYISNLIDPISRLTEIQYINMLTLITLPFVPFVFILIRNSKALVPETKKVAFQDAQEVLKQH